jgi:hypothetical protein
VVSSCPSTTTPQAATLSSASTSFDPSVNSKIVPINLIGELNHGDVVNQTRGE